MRFIHLPVSFALLVVPFLAQAQFELSADNQFFAVQNVLKSHHIWYAELAPEVSKRLPRQFVHLLDPHGRILLKQDADSLQCIMNRYAQQSFGKTHLVLDACLAIYQQRHRQLYDTLSALGEVDFFQPDTIQYAPHDRTPYYSADMDLHVRRRVKGLKMGALMTHVGDSVLRGKDPKTIQRQLNETLRHHLADELCSMEREQSRLNEILGHALFNAYSQCFDPHTMFFPMQTAELFESSLSSEMYTTGLMIEEGPLGQILVSYVMPGSHASEDQEIAPGDEVKGVYVQGELVPAACLDQEDLFAQFYGRESDSLRLRIQSSNQKVREVTLQKRMLTNIANIAQAGIFETPHHRIGYLTLPSFYDEGENAGEALAKQIIQIRDSVDGIILDLRNNGGGAINEALDIAGQFIDAGPLLLGVQKDQPVSVFRDTRRGRVYSGKVMLLVNEHSASAAEMTVSALRHYPQVLVVGSQTFGKSTGQQIIPVFERENDEMPFGFVKTTTLLIYDLNGHSFQGEGIQPDVLLPAGPQYHGHEHQQTYALNLPPVAKKVQTPVVRSEPIADLQRQSQARIPHTSLEQVARLIGRIDSMLSDYIQLDLAYAHFKGWPLEVPDILDTTGYFTVLTADQLPARLPESYWEAVATDPYLVESVRIFEDWLKLTENTK